MILVIGTPKRAPRALGNSQIATSKQDCLTERLAPPLADLLHRLRLYHILFAMFFRCLPQLHFIVIALRRSPIPVASSEVVSFHEAPLRPLRPYGSGERSEPPRTTRIYAQAPQPKLFALPDGSKPWSCKGDTACQISSDHVSYSQYCR